MPEQPDTIAVFASAPEEPASRTRGIAARRYYPAAIDVPLDRLQRGLSEFLAGIDVIISDSPSRFGRYNLEVIEIGAQIDGTGRVGFLGTGAEVSAAASITLHLKRSGPET
jgi:hypothetical protein